MLFNPRKAGYESGLVVWWSEYSYAAIGVTVVEPSDGFEIRTIVCRQPTGKAVGITVRSITLSNSNCADLVQELYPLLESQTLNTTPEMPKDQPVELLVNITPGSYVLSLSCGPTNATFTFKTQDLTVMPPVGGVFTGALYGIYAFGKGEPVLDPSDFTNIIVQGGVKEGPPRVENYHQI
jgi:hypothetical protein